MLGFLTLLVLTIWRLLVDGQDEYLQRQPYGVKMCEELGLKKRCSVTYDKNRLVCVLATYPATTDAFQKSTGCKGQDNVCKRERALEDVDTPSEAKLGDVLTGRCLISQSPTKIHQFVFANQSFAKYHVSHPVKMFGILALAYSQKTKAIYMAIRTPPMLLYFLKDHKSSIVETGRQIRSIAFDDVNNVAIVNIFTGPKKPAYMISTANITGYRNTDCFEQKRYVYAPRMISLDPTRRRIFVLHFYTIVSCNYSGNDVSTVFKSRFRGLHSFFYDVKHESLYYSQGKCLYRKLLPNGLVDWTKKLNFEPKHIMAHNKFVYVVTQYTFELFSPSQNLSVVTETVPLITTPFKTACIP